MLEDGTNLDQVVALDVVVLGHEAGPPSFAW